MKKKYNFKNKNSILDVRVVALKTLELCKKQNVQFMTATGEHINNGCKLHIPVEANF